MEIAEFIALKCPNCGGRLEVSKDMSNFACGYCGSSIVTSRRGGTVTLSLEEATFAIQKNTDRTAAELALRRLPAELEIKERELEEKASTLQVRGYHLRDAGNIGGFGLKPIYGASAIFVRTLAGFFGLLMVVGVAVATLNSDHELLPVPWRIILGCILLMPFPVGFVIGRSVNRKNRALNAQTMVEKAEAVRLNIIQVQKAYDAAKAEHDEAVSQVASLKDRIAKHKAVADS